MKHNDHAAMQFISDLLQLPSFRALNHAQHIRLVPTRELDTALAQIERELSMLREKRPRAS